MACPCPVRTKSRACAVSWSGSALFSPPLPLLLLPLRVVSLCCRGGSRGLGSRGRWLRVGVGLGLRGRRRVRWSFLACPLSSVPPVAFLAPLSSSPAFPFAPCRLAVCCCVLCRVGSLVGRGSCSPPPLLVCSCCDKLVPSTFTEHGGLHAHHAPGSLEGMVAVYFLTMIQYLSGVIGLFRRPHFHRSLSMWRSHASPSVGDNLDYASRNL